MKTTINYMAVLGIICVIATGLLATVNSLTSPQVQAQSQKELDDSLREVMPDADKFEPVKTGGEIIYYKALNKEGKITGTAFKASGKGYSSTIETLVGMNPDGTINTIKVLSQNETPGLGSRITEIQEGSKNKKPWFQAQFNQKKLNDLDSVQTITGATISSTAVIESVKQKAKEIEGLLKNAK